MAAYKPLKSVSKKEQILLKKIWESDIPASTLDRPGDDHIVDLVVDYEKFNLPRTPLARLWKNGYISVKNGKLKVINQ